MTSIELKEFLDEKVVQYNNLTFIESDPIQVPHSFNLKEDIEISAFLTATIAWGNRKMIISNAKKMMELLGNSPYDFVLNHKPQNLNVLSNFVHRTFNSTDLQYFIKSLKNIYLNYNGLEHLFYIHCTANSTQNAIHNFKKVFFELPHQQRIEKHLPDPLNGSAAKRINMFMRVIKMAN